MNTEAAAWVESMSCHVVDAGESGETFVDLVWWDGFCGVPRGFVGP